MRKYEHNTPNISRAAAAGDLFIDVTAGYCRPILLNNTVSYIILYVVGAPCSVYEHWMKPGSRLLTYLIQKVNILFDIWRNFEYISFKVMLTAIKMPYVLPCFFFFLGNQLTYIMPSLINVKIWWWRSGFVISIIWIFFSWLLTLRPSFYHHFPEQKSEKINLKKHLKLYSICFLLSTSL